MTGSGAQWAGLGEYGVLGATTLFGGIGSAAFGGDFIDGAITGLNIGLYNHTWVDGGELPEVTVTGKARFHLNTAVISQPMPYPVRSPGVLGLVVGVFWICEHRADLEKGIERAYSSLTPWPQRQWNAALDMSIILWQDLTVCILMSEVVMYILMQVTRGRLAKLLMDQEGMDRHGLIITV